MARCVECASSITYRAVKSCIPRSKELDESDKSDKSSQEELIRSWSSFKSRISRLKGHDQSGEWLRERPIRTWSSFNDLIQGVLSGCDLCLLCKDYLDSHFVDRSATLHQESRVVKLKVRDDELILDFGTFRSATIRVTKSTRIKNAQSGNKHEASASTQPFGHSGLRFPGRAMNLDFFKLSQVWLRKCYDTHGSCNINEVLRAARLPKRLIDVTGSEKVLIADCQAWISAGLACPEELGRYCTLSYQWGVPSHECVLTETFPQSLAIEVRIMPQTFRDALLVAKNLGIRFLWIDALCIVQQDRREVEEEVSRMGDIYERATCTIAATAARNVHDGFLKALDVYQAANPCRIKDSSSLFRKSCLSLLPSPLSFTTSVVNSSLNRRGWVTQERALSTRILHFTALGLFWECGTIKANCQDPEGESTNGVSCRSSNEGLLSMARVRQSNHFCLAKWEHFIQEYCNMEFTHPRDRLLALSAVVQAVAPVLRQGVYLAGVWKDTLKNGLLWQYVGLKESCRLQPPIAPTWSWASVVGSVRFLSSRLGLFCGGFAKIIDAAVVPDNAHCPYGSAGIGWLKIKGTLEPAGRVGVRHFTKGYAYSWDEQWYHDRESYHKTRNLLPLGYERTIFDKNLTVFGLVLEVAKLSDQHQRVMRESPDTVYRRIGWFEHKVSKDDFDRDVELRYSILSAQELCEMKSQCWREPWRVVNCNQDVITII
jgi:hypothetical protein